MQAPGQYGKVEAHERYKFKRRPRQKTRLIALLFCRPELALMKTDIIPSLPYFDNRAGGKTAFYFAGFFEETAYPESVMKSLLAEKPYAISLGEDGTTIATSFRESRHICLTVAGPKGRFWVFSPHQFDRMRREIESKTTWHYSGGCDMILLNSRRGIGLDFSAALVLHLDQIDELTTTPTISQLFESIFQYAENQNDDNPTWGFSDSLGIKIVKRGLWDFIVGLLPVGARRAAKAARNVAVKNIALDAAKAS